MATTPPLNKTRSPRSAARRHQTRRKKPTHRVARVCISTLLIAVGILWLPTAASAQHEDPGSTFDPIPALRPVYTKGAPGSSVLLGEADVDPELVGESCDVVADLTNQASVHPGNTLVVTSGDSTVEVEDIEDAADTVTHQESVLVLGETISVSIVLGPDGRTSVGPSLHVTCQPVDPPPPVLVTVDICVFDVTQTLTYDPDAMSLDQAANEQFGIGTWMAGPCTDSVDVCVNGIPRTLTYDPEAIELDQAADEQFGAGSWALGPCTASVCVNGVARILVYEVDGMTAGAAADAEFGAGNWELGPCRATLCVNGTTLDLPYDVEVLTAEEAADAQFGPGNWEFGPCLTDVLICVNNSQRTLSYDADSISAEAAAEAQFSGTEWSFGECPGGQPCPAPPSTAFLEQLEGSPERQQIWRIYTVLLHREPDQVGFDFWTGQRFAGANHFDIAEWLYQSVEAQNRGLAELSDNEFLEYLYQAIGCRESDPDGLAYWLERLDQGAPRSVVAVYFAELPEYLNKTNTQFNYVSWT